MSLITPTSSKATIEPTSSDYKVAYDLLQHQYNYRDQILYVPVTHLTLSICKTLFLNNYEVNTIVSSYLTLWSNNSENNHITKAEMESYFEPENIGFVRNFFIDNTISCNDFVLFVCFFLFYNSDDILSVLLSMCGVTSNLLITKEQVNRFLRYFGFSLVYSKDLFIFLERSGFSSPHCSDMYDIKLFINYMRDCHTYLTAVHKIKLNIKKYTFDDETMKNIIARKNYYNYEIHNMYKVNPEMNFSTLHLSPPKRERCFSKCVRIVFTNKPPPYHYDFCIDCSPHKARINLLFQIKQRFGYSKRGSTCFTSFSTSHDNNHTSRGSSCGSYNNKYSLGMVVNKIVPYPSSVCSK